MDCLFNKMIPTSTDNVFILRPTSKTFIDGLAESYETTYFPELSNYITEREYTYTMEKIMDEVSSVWPCCYCFTCGYVCCICTLGLSFCFPYYCISQAKSDFQKAINDANENVFLPKKLKLSYRSKCSTSWLEIEILNKSSNNTFPLYPREDSKISLIKNQL